MGALGAEHWEQSYQDVFLCCPEDLDNILQSPLTELECTTSCMLENGISSVATWVDGTCTCSLSAFVQCDPFGEVEEGYSTCQRYFNRFGDDECNYDLKSHQLCANEDFDYDGTQRVEATCGGWCGSCKAELVVRKIPSPWRVSLDGRDLAPGQWTGTGGTSYENCVKKAEAQKV